MRKTICFKKLDVDLINEWKQIMGKYNWVEIHPLMVRFEKENLHGIMEIEMYLLGFGIRFYWTWNQEMLNNKIEEYGRKIKEGKWHELTRNK